MKKRTIRIALFSFISLFVLLCSLFLYSRPWPNALFITPLYELSQTEKIVALTFDDGPSAGRTTPLLDLLKAEEVPATFFMVGQKIKQFPELAQRVFDEGHLIGNHSYTHPRMYLRSLGFLRVQIERTDSLILGLGQTEVRYFRPPYSAKFILLPLLLNTLDKTLVTGTYDPPSEYKSPFPAEAVAQEVLENITPGCIIFLHDGKKSDPEAFVKSVELIIKGLKAQGYKFVRLDQE